MIANALAAHFTPEQIRALAYLFLDAARRDGGLRGLSDVSDQLFAAERIAAEEESPVQEGAYAEGFEVGRIQGIRDAAAYINRVGGLLGSNEYQLKKAGAPELLRALADAVAAGVVKL